jgi:hypothetical protein
MKRDKKTAFKTPFLHVKSDTVLQLFKNLSVKNEKFFFTYIRNFEGIMRAIIFEKESTVT